MQSNFVKTPVAVGVALALGVAGPSQVHAQDDSDEPIEEIITTAIRSSLQSAQALKENADTFVDGITASDIGALPDRSVAEALQRVPGVNISRFKKTTDPDRFSVEGADVIIRGLPFTRSELNGRDVFSATGGVTLSFNDVSPELLGGVLVYKNATADMIDGGIAGTVNLVTRKPLDTDGFKFAGSTEWNYGDLAEEGSPTFSFLGSNTWDTDAGSFGVQVGWADSELNTRSYASQVTDPCYRLDTLDAGCIRVTNVGSGGVDGGLNFTPDEFPPAGTVIVPKGAGVRATDYERRRDAFSLIGQWESPGGEVLVTAEYLRAEADLFVDENAVLALVNDDLLFPEPALGTDWTFRNGAFQSGVLSQFSGRGQDDCLPGSLDSPEGLTRPCNATVGVPTELLRFQRKDDSVTEDLSLDISWTPNDNLTLNFEAQHLKSERSEDGIIGATGSYSDILLDLKGSTPDVQFRTPTTADGSTDSNYFTNPDRTYHSFLLDSQIQNEAEMDTLRADLDYYFGEDGFIREVKFGARWSDRNRITRNNNFQNWGVLTAPWAGFAAYASEPTDGINTYSNTYNKFRDFQRGKTSVPVEGDGSAIYFGGNNFLGEYFNGVTEQQADNVSAFFPFPEWGNQWGPVTRRGNVIEGTPFTEGEISDVSQQTQSVYARVDFGFDGEMPITGNFGVRYVKTTIESDGQLQFPSNPPDIEGGACDIAQSPLPGFCSLSEPRLAEFISAFSGELIADDADVDFDHVLPSFNVKMQVTDNVLVRGAISQGIYRPDLAAFATGGQFFDNTNTLRDSGTLETGPMFAVNTGNRLLRPIEAWNYDLSAEWYFNNVGSLTFSLFRKDFDKLISSGATVRTFTSDTGTTADVEVRGSTNVEDASMQGFELAYQQTFDFLPAPFNALGGQATYTYVDAGELGSPTDTDAGTRQPFGDGLPLPGVSEDTINLVVFYETDAWSARLAYNWRSEFLLTARDDIFPFSPIYGEDTGQLDGSVFYNFNNFDSFTNLRVGLQMVNILDEVTETSQVIDFDGTRYPRTAFRNDRRYTFAVRFDF